MYDNYYLTRIVDKFDIPHDKFEFVPCTVGHINCTYFVNVNGTNEYVLQKINTSIFTDPDGLTNNILEVTSFLRKKIEAEGGNPVREVLTLIPTPEKEYYVLDADNACWRLYYSIKGAATFQSAEKPILFYNSAVAFGRFQKRLSDFPAEKLVETIKNFHNTVSRFTDFKKAVENDLAGRASSVKSEIDFVFNHESVCSYITDRIESGEFPLRVTHNDTKLNNVMIDEETLEGICVIDLDTVMPGSVLYDFGDSIRFGASSAAEDETDLDKVYMRLDLFEEYTKGFLTGLDNSLTKEEMLGLPMGALVITLETGIRFLTDHLNGDTYFKIHRSGHNLDRARTQFKLVSDMEQKMDSMIEIVKKYM